MILFFGGKKDKKKDRHTDRQTGPLINYAFNAQTTLCKMSNIICHVHTRKICYLFSFLYTRKSKK